MVSLFQTTNPMLHERINGGAKAGRGWRGGHSLPPLFTHIRTHFVQAHRLRHRLPYSRWQTCAVYPFKCRNHPASLCETRDTKKTKAFKVARGFGYYRFQRA